VLPGCLDGPYDDPASELDELAVFVAERVQVDGHSHRDYAWYGDVTWPRGRFGDAT